MKNTKKTCIIACGILRKEIEYLQKNGDIDAEVHFLSETLHMDYNDLGRTLSGTIKKRQREYPEGVVVVYGDVCLGFNDEMKKLIDEHDVVKVDALNCIDCLLGGRGKLLEIDPEHKFLFLNPAFMKFGEKLRKTNDVTWEMYSMLDGIILLDAMNDLDEWQSEIDDTVERTGLPILERRNIGLENLKNVLLEALERNRLKHSVNRCGANSTT